MSIIRDYMDTYSYMIVTDKGYFLIHDCLKKEVEETIESFKSKYNFNDVIDIIESPYDYLHEKIRNLNKLSEEGKIEESDYDREFDKTFDCFSDINKNAILMITLDPQM